MVQRRLNKTVNPPQKSQKRIYDLNREKERLVQIGRKRTAGVGATTESSSNRESSARASERWEFIKSQMAGGQLRHLNKGGRGVHPEGSGSVGGGSRPCRPE